MFYVRKELNFEIQFFLMQKQVLQTGEVSVTVLQQLMLSTPQCALPSKHRPGYHTADSANCHYAAASRFVDFYYIEELHVG